MPLTAISTSKLIRSQTLASDNAVIDITGIPSQYKHLKLYILARSAVVATNDQLLLRLGNASFDVGSNYYWQWLTGSAAVVSANNGNNNYINLGYISGATAPANIFGRLIVGLPYYSTSSIKRAILTQSTVRIADAVDNTYSQHNSGSWTSTSVIERIRLLTSSGGNLLAGSKVDLYGEL